MPRTYRHKRGGEVDECHDRDDAHLNRLLLRIKLNIAHVEREIPRLFA